VTGCLFATTETVGSYSSGLTPRLAR